MLNLSCRKGLKNLEMNIDSNFAERGTEIGMPNLSTRKKLKNS